MSEPSTLPWTDEQWALVQRTAADAARRARVASTFLPLVGPLPEEQASVPKLELEERPDEAKEWQRTASARMSIDDGVTLKLTTLACEVYVKTAQAQDPELAAVRQMVSRAAVILGRLEDAIVMRGQADDKETPPAKDPEEPDYDPDRPLVVEPEIYRVQGGQKNPGLRDVGSTVAYLKAEVGDDNTLGEELVKEVADVIQALERLGHYGPFGAMLGEDLYAAAHRPSPGSLVLPADRFVPFLAGGPLLRSSVLPSNEGVLVATAGAPIDLVIASDVHVSYVQRTPEPRYVLRVSERMVLRLKQPDAVARLVVNATGERPPKPPAAAL